MVQYPTDIPVHSVSYTSTGDIILNADAAPAPAKVSKDIPMDAKKSMTTPSRKAQGWTTVHEQKPATISEKKSSALLQSAGAEGARQFSLTASEAIQELKHIRSGMRSIPSRISGTIRRLWGKAQHDVRMPAAIRKHAKPDTRLKQFAVDTVRFGGTFALIFGVLFVGMNYQSFFQIAKAELALGSDTKTEQKLERIVSGTQNGDAESASTSLLAYLPSVGPYEDRLVIPKLGENVPIVKPSMDALMKEDWKQFENDIQSALHDGVVHYPGSARPGQAGNFFLTGHSSYYPWDDGKYKDVFARLGKLETGDTYSVYYGGDRHTYRVTGKKEVKPSDTTVLDQPVNKRIATLMTCTPVGTTLRRLIVTAEEIDPSTGEILAVGEKSAENQAMPTARLDSLPI